jgi:glycine oxidase
VSDSPEVLIAGGGIIGCSIAYHLAKEGAKVTIVERESIGSQASGAATGLLSAMTTADTPDHFFQLEYESRERHREIVPELRELSGVDPEFADFSWLELAFTEEEENELKGYLGHDLETSPNKSLFTDTDIQHLEPRTTNEARSGIYIDGQAQVDPYKLTLAFAGAAESLGTTVKYGKVTGLTSQAGRVTGLNTSLGDMEADAVVMCIGSWSNQLGDWIGTPVPVEPLKGQTMHIEIDGPPVPCMIHHVASYVAPKVAGYVVAGTYDGFLGYDTTIHDQGKLQITEGVETVCPGVMEGKIINHVTGLRPVSADYLPILGPISGFDGAYIATGHQRAGILLSAITGELMSQLVLGRETRLPLDPYHLDRFAGADLEVALKDRYGLTH